MNLLEFSELVERANINKEAVEFIIQEKDRTQNIDIDHLMFLHKMYSDWLSLDIKVVQMGLVAYQLIECNKTYKQIYEKVFIEEL